MPMQRKTPPRRIFSQTILPAALLLACALFPTGCASPTNNYSDPTLSAASPEETAMLVEPWDAQVHLLSIDGNKVKPAGGFPPRERRTWLRPGIHILVVNYATGNAHSVQNAEVTLVCEPNHRYRMDDWPPKVTDITTGKKVQARARVAD